MNGGIEGMTEQDNRVARKVQVSRGYRSENYYLPTSAIKELVGHPLVFLMESDNILVEIVAAKPSIEVVKTKKGYLLKSDLDMGAGEFVIQKETNTRYKVYDLSPNNAPF